MFSSQAFFNTDFQLAYRRKWQASVERNSVCFSHEAKTAMACRVSFIYAWWKHCWSEGGILKDWQLGMCSFFRVCIPPLPVIHQKNTPHPFLFFILFFVHPLYRYLLVFLFLPISSFTDPHNAHLAFDLSAFFLFLFGHLPTCILIAYLYSLLANWLRRRYTNKSVT